MNMNKKEREREVEVGGLPKLWHPNSTPLDLYFLRPGSLPVAARLAPADTWPGQFVPCLFLHETFTGGHCLE